jgi:hypothetical protein
MKAELLSLAFIYFFESGLFNGLQPIQTKKFPAVVAGCVQGVPDALLLLCHPVQALRQPRAKSGQQK